MELPDDNKSKFDLTLQTLIYVNNLVNEAIEYRRMCYINGRNVDALNGWFHTLDPIFIELHPKLTKTQYIELEQLYKKITSMDISILVTSYIERQGKKIKVVNRLEYDKLFKIVREFDKRLRYYMDIKGMRIASQEDARWAMGGN